MRVDVPLQRLTQRLGNSTRSTGGANLILVLEHRADQPTIWRVVEVGA